MNRFPDFYWKRFLTTYLTITGFGAHGNSGDESFKEQLFRNKRCQKGAENVRKKFHQLFGTVKPIIRNTSQNIQNIPAIFKNPLKLLSKSYSMCPPHMY